MDGGRGTRKIVENPSDQGDAADELAPFGMRTLDARELQWPPLLKTKSFKMKHWPTKFSQCDNARLVRDEYYDEVRELVECGDGRGVASTALQAASPRRNLWRLGRCPTAHLRCRGAGAAGLKAWR